MSLGELLGSAVARRRFRVEVDRLRASLVEPSVTAESSEGFVADPFLAHDPRSDGYWLLFEECANLVGRIRAVHLDCYGRIDSDRVDVLDRRPMHSSYPHVASCGGSIVMTVESGVSHGDGTVRHYVTSEELFPFGWTECKGLSLAPGQSDWNSRQITDTNIFVWRDRCYALFSGADIASRTQQIGIAVLDSSASVQTWRVLNGGEPLACISDSTKWSGYRMGGDCIVDGDFVYFFCQVNSGKFRSPYDPRGDLSVVLARLDVKRAADQVSEAGFEFLEGVEGAVVASGWGGRRWDSRLVHHLSLANLGQGHVMMAYDGCGMNGSWAIGVGCVAV